MVEAVRRSGEARERRRRRSGRGREREKRMRWERKEVAMRRGREAGMERRAEGSLTGRPKKP